MIRDIPPFDLGFVTNGAGNAVDDTAIAYSTHAGIERELELKGDGASDLMPIIVQAVNSYDEMTAALRTARSQLVTLGGDPGDDEDGDQIQAAVLSMIDTAIAKAEGF